MAHWSLVTYTRPSTEVAWFTPGSEVLNVIETLKSDNTITTYQKSESSDGLKQYYKICFKDQESALAMESNETYMSNATARQTYCTENNITFLVEQFEEAEPIV